MSDLTELTIPRPHVAFVGLADVPSAVSDAFFLDMASRNLAAGLPLGGAFVTSTVIKLLHDTASALRVAHEVAALSREGE